MSRTATVALILLAPAVAAGACAFECGVTPGEGIMHFAAAAERLTLRSAPSSLSAQAPDLELASRAEIPYDAVRCRTVTPGLLVAPAPGSFEGSSYGPISYLSWDDYAGFGAGPRVFEFAAGDTIEYLQYRAEGDFFARFHGEVIAIHSRPVDDGTLTEVAEPVTELWIRVTSSAGEPLGWLLVAPGVVRELPRTF